MNEIDGQVKKTQELELKVRYLIRKYLNFNLGEFKRYSHSSDSRIANYAKEILAYFEQLKVETENEYVKSLPYINHFIALISNYLRKYGSVASLNFQIKVLGNYQNCLFELIKNEVCQINNEIQSTIIYLRSFQKKLKNIIVFERHIELYNELNDKPISNFSSLLNDKSVNDDISLLIENDENFQKIDFLISKLGLLRSDINSFNNIISDKLSNLKEKRCSLIDKKNNISQDLKKDEIIEYINSLDDITITLIVASCYNCPTFNTVFYKKDTKENGLFGCLTSSTIETQRFYLYSWINSLISYLRIMSGGNQ